MTQTPGIVSPVLVRNKNLKKTFINPSVGTFASDTGLVFG